MISASDLRKATGDSAEYMVYSEAFESMLQYSAARGHTNLTTKIPNRFATRFISELRNLGYTVRYESLSEELTVGW